MVYAMTLTTVWDNLTNVESAWWRYSTGSCNCDGDVLDDCICGGDGTSCVGCTTTSWHATMIQKPPFPMRLNVFWDLWWMHSHWSLQLQSTLTIDDGSCDWCNVSKRCPARETNQRSLFALHRIKPCCSTGAYNVSHLCQHGECHRPHERSIRRCRNPFGR